MSGTVVQAAPTGVEPPATDRRRRTAAVLALARFEARELVRQIPVLVFFLLYVGYTCWTLWSGREGMDAFPALQDADRETQARPLLVGIALFVCVNRAVLRSRRRGTDRHFDVLVMEPWRRTVAHVLSAVPFAVATALVVLFDFVCTALKPGAIGHGSPAELAVGPLTVLLGAVAGALLARLFPSGFAAPLLIVGALVLASLASTQVADEHWAQWLWPVVAEGGSDPFPSELVGRPAAWHALYLAGLVVVLACTAVLLSGGRTRAVRAVAVLALVATGAGIAGQSPGDPASLAAARTEVSVSPEKTQSCLTHGGSKYCAFPEWSDRTADWAAVVDRVQTLAGGAAGGRELTVRQRLEARYGLTDDSALDPSRTPGQVTVGTRWGGNRVPEFAVAVAAVLVAGDEKSAETVCDARMVMVAWLALGGEQDPLTTFRHVRLDDSISGSAVILAPTGALSMTAQQTAVVRELFEQPRYGVTAKVKAHWAELTAPGTTTRRAAELLDVKTPTDEPATEEEKCGE
ncbi:ABC transporter permease [Streptomyces sp. NPDC059785]|uniref:ABC transporter permease n=1 Tax=Streptomyces sp. NPDC059785 TaxID=3346945 RepID=UPI00364B9841